LFESRSSPKKSGLLQNLCMRRWWRSAERLLLTSAAVLVTTHTQNWESSEHTQSPSSKQRCTQIVVPRWKSHPQSHRRTNAQTHRHTDTQTHRHTDTQTHRHTDTQTHRHTNTILRPQKHPHRGLLLKHRVSKFQSSRINILNYHPTACASTHPAAGLVEQSGRIPYLARPSQCIVSEVLCRIQGTHTAVVCSRDSM